MRGKYLTVGNPIKLSDSPTDVTRSPLLGEHTDEVMAELGYTRRPDRDAAKPRRDLSLVSHREPPRRRFQPARFKRSRITSPSRKDFDDQLDSLSRRRRPYRASARWIRTHPRPSIRRRRCFDKPMPTGTVLRARRRDAARAVPAEQGRRALEQLSRAVGRSSTRRRRTHPLFLIKPPMSVIGPGEAIRRPKSYQRQDRVRRRTRHRDRQDAAAMRSVEEAEATDLRLHAASTTSPPSNCCRKIPISRNGAARRASIRSVASDRRSRPVSTGATRTSSRRSTASSARTIRSTT